MDLIGGIELGGTYTRCVLAHSPTQIVRELQVPTKDPSSTLSELVDFFAHASVRRIGVACFGPLQCNPAEADYGVIQDTPKVGWHGIDLPAWLSPVGAQVVVTTDVNAAVLAESKFGAGRGAPVCLYVTVGTGIGAGLVVDTHLLPGSKHPELGHIYLRRVTNDDWPGCCPFHGDCLEGLASGAALAARWGQPGETLPETHQAWVIEADYLAQLCVTALRFTSPQRIILGGGVMNQADLLDRVRSNCAKLLGGYHSYSLAELESIIVAPELPLPGLSGALLLAAHSEG